MFRSRGIYLAAFLLLGLALVVQAKLEGVANLGTLEIEDKLQVCHPTKY